MLTEEQKVKLVELHRQLWDGKYDIEIGNAKVPAIKTKHGFVIKQNVSKSSWFSKLCRSGSRISWYIRDGVYRALIIEVENKIKVVE